jgi:hypothetical protein
MKAGYCIFPLFAMSMLEDKLVTTGQAQGYLAFQARFQLVTAMN